jgi:hypothetical protein
MAAVQPEPWLRALITNNNHIFLVVYQMLADNVVFHEQDNTSDFIILYQMSGKYLRCNNILSKVRRMLQKSSASSFHIPSN